MADTFSKDKRSAIMKSVKSSGNKSTELKLISFFKVNGITGWRRKYTVKGHPDFVFIEKRIAVFVDGCFWHGHNCRNIRPKDNEDYWNRKRIRNVAHDQDVTNMFSKRGWTVIRIWECELKKKNESMLRDKLKVLL